MTSPSARKPTADGTTKNATRGERGVEPRAQTARALRAPAPVSRDISGSSAAETDMPNRLTGSR